MKTFLADTEAVMALFELPPLPPLALGPVPELVGEPDPEPEPEAVAPGTRDVGGAVVDAEPLLAENARMDAISKYAVARSGVPFMITLSQYCTKAAEGNLSEGEQEGETRWDVRSA